MPSAQKILAFIIYFRFCLKLREFVINSVITYDVHPVVLIVTLYIWLRLLHICSLVVEGSKHQEDVPSLVSGASLHMKHHPSLNENNLNVSSNLPSRSCSAATSIEADKVADLLHSCDSHTLLPLVALFSTYHSALPRGIVSSQLLPAFAVCWQQAMATSSHYPYPISNSARVSSPSLVPLEDGKISKDSYLRPVTRSITHAGSRSQGKYSQAQIEKVSTTRNGRTNSRSRRLSQHNDGNNNISAIDTEASATSTVVRRKVKDGQPKTKRAANGHLSPENEPKSSLRDISRSQSPSGLIPVHRSWRSFVSLPKITISYFKLTRDTDTSS